jgi:hypothetical protein
MFCTVYFCDHRCPEKIELHRPRQRYRLDLDIDVVLQLLAWFVVARVARRLFVGWIRVETQVIGARHHGPKHGKRSLNV